MRGVLDRARSNASQVAVQLLHFAAEHRADARRRAAVGQVLDRLHANRHAIVAAIAPHLDDRSADVRAITAEWLAQFEDRSPSRPPDFSAYLAIFEADVRAGREVQGSLVRFMYASDPGQAVLTMMRAHGLREPAAIRPILWAEHVVADLMWRRRMGFVSRDAVDAAAPEQIEKMSRHPAWWARLYAAEVLRRHRELGTDAMVQRLAGDGNRLVREAAAAIGDARR